MKTNLISLVNFFFLFIFLLGLVIFVFWYFGILKQEFTLSSEILEIEDKINFINSYSFQDLNQYLTKLPQIKYDIPSIDTSEIGRNSLF